MIMCVLSPKFSFLIPVWLRMPKGRAWKSANGIHLRRNDYQYCCRPPPDQPDRVIRSQIIGLRSKMGAWKASPAAPYLPQQLPRGQDGDGYQAQLSQPHSGATAAAGPLRLGSVSDLFDAQLGVWLEDLLVPTLRLGKNHAFQHRAPLIN